MTDSLLYLAKDHDVTDGSTDNEIDFGLPAPDKGGTPRRANMRFTFRDIVGSGRITCILAASPTGSGYVNRVTLRVDYPEDFESQNSFELAIPVHHDRWVKGNVSVDGITSGLVDIDIIAG